MSQFSEAKIYSELIPLFEMIVNKCHALDQKLVSYGEGDARRLAIGGIQKVVGGYLFGYTSIIHGRSVAQIYESFGDRHNMKAEEAQKMMEDAWRQGLLAIFHFRLDSLFQNLLRAQGSYKGKPGFATMARDLITLCKIDDPRKLNLLLLTTYLRNSFHNNGVHRGDSLSMEFLDLKYDLKKDGTVKCAGINHVLAAIFETVELLDIMLTTEPLKSIKGPIPDDYLLDPAD